MLVDSHCHLDFPQFDSDREQVIERAVAAGVDLFLAIGVGKGPPELDAGLRMTKFHPSIYATVGVHPHEAKLAEEPHFAELERLGRDPKVLAIGEIGLDFHYDHSPREVQERVFIRQMELAASLQKPIIIHCREAWPECMELLRHHWRGGGILHCFSGSLAVAREALEMGFLISFAGTVSFPKTAELREVSKQVPMDRLLAETDSPYLAPVPHRGQRNEPAFVADVVRALAAARGVPAEDVARQTSANFRNFFGIGAE